MFTTTRWVNILFFKVQKLSLSINAHRKIDFKVKTRIPYLSYYLPPPLLSLLINTIQHFHPTFFQALSLTLNLIQQRKQIERIEVCCLDDVGLSIILHRVNCTHCFGASDIDALDRSARGGWHLSSNWVTRRKIKGLLDLTRC